MEELLGSVALTREVDVKMEHIASFRREKWKISLKMKRYVKEKKGGGEGEGVEQERERERERERGKEFKYRVYNSKLIMGNFLLSVCFGSTVIFTFHKCFQVALICLVHNFPFSHSIFVHTHSS